MTGQLLALAAAVWFSLGSLCVRAGSDHLDRGTGLLVCLLTNLAVLVIAVGGWALAVGVSPVRWTAVALFAGAGLCSSLLARWATFGAIPKVGPSRAALMRNVQPVFTAALAIGFLGEYMSLGGGLAALLVLVGVAATSIERSGSVSAGARWGVRPGERAAGAALALLGAAGYSVAYVLRKSGMDLWEEPLLGALVGVLVATAGSMLVRRGDRQRAPAGGDRRLGFAYFALYGVLAAAAQVCVFSSLLTTEVWITNIFVCTEPAVTVLLSWLLFRGREPFSGLTLASIAAVVVGSALLVLA